MSAAGSGAPAIFIVGFMGAGKTAVGRSLAEALDRTFVDTDRLLEERSGRTVAAIFREDGEGAFREAEWRALLSLAGRRDVVVATGGGAFLGDGARRFMRTEGIVVWLDVPLAVARARVGAGDGRPLWSADDATLRAIFDRRRAAYALADVRVDASSAAVDDVVRLAVASLSRFAPLFR